MGSYHYLWFNVLLGTEPTMLGKHSASLSIFLVSNWDIFKDQDKLPPRIVSVDCCVHRELYSRFADPGGCIWWLCLLVAAPSLVQGGTFQKSTSVYHFC